MILQKSFQEKMYQQICFPQISPYIIIKSLCKYAPFYLQPVHLCIDRNYTYMITVF
jgi:hypothetical protein